MFCVPNPKSQFFNLDTTSEVLFGLESRGTSHQEMEQALFNAAKVCGIGPLLDRNIFALSGGEKQRIACASAYAMGPEIFVLDEPSSNLDSEGIRQLREILKQLKAAGKTVLVAEHRLWYCRRPGRSDVLSAGRSAGTSVSKGEIPRTARRTTPGHGAA